MLDKNKLIKTIFEYFNSEYKFFQGEELDTTLGTYFVVQKHIASP